MSDAAEREVLGGGTVPTPGEPQIPKLCPPRGPGSSFLSADPEETELVSTNSSASLVHNGLNFPTAQFFPLRDFRITSQPTSPNSHSPAPPSPPQPSQVSPRVAALPRRQEAELSIRHTCAGFSGPRPRSGPKVQLSRESPPGSSTSVSRRVGGSRGYVTRRVSALAPGPTEPW